MSPKEIKPPILTEDNSSAALIMRFKEGKSLDHYLSRDQDGGHISKKTGLFKQFSFTLLQRLTAAIQIGDAIARIHAHGIIHRDIKPGNLIMELANNVSRNIHAIDFGLAKWKGDDGADNDFVGTQGYIAPEIMFGNIDEKSDAYAYAVILYKLFWDIMKECYRDNSYEELSDKQIIRIRKCINYAIMMPQETRATVEEIKKVFLDTLLEVEAAKQGMNDNEQRKQSLLI